MLIPGQCSQDTSAGTWNVLTEMSNGNYISGKYYH